MDWAYLPLGGLIGVTIAVAVGVPVVGFIVMARILRKDEAIDIATFLALREPLEHGPK